MTKNSQSLKSKAKLVKKLLLQSYPAVKCELNYKNDYELLVAIILSAQCTDIRVNIIAKEFFTTFTDVASLANAELSEITEIVKSCSYFNNKAKSLSLMAKKVVREFDGILPKTEDGLLSLAGVGRKTAHVFLGELLGQNFMAVDTHVFRVSHRLGLSTAKHRRQMRRRPSRAF